MKFMLMNSVSACATTSSNFDFGWARRAARLVRLDETGRHSPVLGYNKMPEKRIFLEAFVFDLPVFCLRMALEFLCARETSHPNASASGGHIRIGVS